MTQRVLSAFVMRETDPAQSPLRRGIGAVFAGIMVAVLVGAGFGVYGILTKVGGTAWKADGSIVIERETGATFVFMDGRLHPTLNFTSALLASGRGASQLFRVSQKSLGSVPRGITIGITGAPDSLPRPAGPSGCRGPSAPRRARRAPAGRRQRSASWRVRRRPVHVPAETARACSSRTSRPA
ncbi:type VII secretion protein EccB [Dactylosporangium cerinum]